MSRKLFNKVQDMTPAEKILIASALAEHDQREGLGAMLYTHHSNIDISKPPANFSEFVLRAWYLDEISYEILLNMLAYIENFVFLGDNERNNFRRLAQDFDNTQLLATCIDKTNKKMRPMLTTQNAPKTI